MDRTHRGLDKLDCPGAFAANAHPHASSTAPLDVDGTRRRLVPGPLGVISDGSVSASKGYELESERTTAVRWIPPYAVRHGDAQSVAASGIRCPLEIRGALVTFNPPDLVAVQGDVQALINIPLNSLGILGDTDHVDGGDSYHLGKDQLSAHASYSLTESPRDRHPTNAASAFDIGNAWRLGATNDAAAKALAQNAFLRFNRIYVAALKANVEGSEDIREIIYTPDGTTVKRLDVLGIRTTGDDKHLTHTHTSFFRDSEGRHAGAYRTLLLSLIGQAISEEDDFMATVRQQDWDALIWRVEGLAAGRDTAAGGPTKGTPIGLVVRLEAVERKLDAVSQAVTEVGPEVAVKLRDQFKKIDDDQAATLEAVQNVATDVSLDAALRELLDRHATGALDAEAVVRRMHDLLTGPTV
jgi:hypothetical protein